MINLRLIEIFRSVMRHMTTIGASRELGISQPGVSNAIRHFEDQIGFPLFDRSANRLVPREEAKIIFRESEGLFLLSNSLNQLIDDLKADRRGYLRVAATPQFGHSILPRAIRNFVRDQPRVKVHLDVNQSQNVMDAVESSAAEFGLALGLEQEITHTFDMISLGQAKLAAIIPVGHPLASRAEVGPEDMRDAPFIGVEQTSRLGVLVRSVFREAAVTYNPDIEVKYSETAGRLAEAGAGITIIDSFSASGLLGLSGCVVTPLISEVKIDAWAIHLRGRLPSRVAALMISHVRDVLAAASFE